ncbi:MAG TPA: glycine--tRNA ligase subunit beta, partial [Anaerolineaceae bacterium]|nr:glycine--tRNA ligase subunit beta [Anaerolineaceae bacterium]
MSLDFQSIIIKLQQFWNEQGCLIWQPYYTQVGAGTMNPATSLRVLGPEPWNVAYVEPSVRPDDGRYGENPNRLQMHTQFQVILKPDPGNPQEIYLKSLQALGVNPAEHDIRFVEDKWESPALGAWGLGWEVWLDGQEITQFTYFQQAGGMAMDPVSVEITYGLERIAIALQKVSDFKDIQWSPQRTYGEVHLLGEQEHSKYYFEVADVQRLRQMFDLFEAEANEALNHGLILPAHDNVLKCSHTFNVLDTRGAIGVTERQALFSRMREISRKVAEAYYQQREEMGFPWKVEKLEDQMEATRTESVPLDPKVLKGKAPFLFEIGCEELPVGDFKSVLIQLEERVNRLLDDLRLSHGPVNVSGTPRRLVVNVEDMDQWQSDLVQTVKGPPADRAFNPDGTPTKAAEGFARGKGVDVSALGVSEMDGGRYVTVEVQQKGLPAVQVLAEALPDLMASLKFDKSMRWNASNVSFSRPIRWLLAMVGDQLIPFDYAGLRSEAKTRGLRFHDPEMIEVKDTLSYFEHLESQNIILDVAKRRQVIEEQVKKLIRNCGGADHRIDEDLLDEVNLMVESPTAFIGSFEDEYLALPSEVLTSVMKKHQRYFPVFDVNGELMRFFIGVRNGDDQHMEQVIDGNEQVVRARFADAAFFIKEDLKQSLVEVRPALSGLTFQYKLGSLLDKTERIEKVVPNLIDFFKLSELEARVTRRAAHLCKADLVTHMVIEMTSLQGVMGQYYAMKAGEQEDVARSIYEHYLPRFSGDQMPGSRPGFILSLADRLDTLAGLFAAGLAPSGTKDPFAQRRAASGLVQMLIAWDLDFDLREGLKLAASALPIEMKAEDLDACLEFIYGRLQSNLLEQGYRYDVVAAILAAQAFNPAAAVRAIKILMDWIKRSDWDR